MKTSYKILTTVLALILSLFFAFIGLAIASSSHNVPHEGGAIFGLVSLLLGTLSIIAIWLPWRKILKK